VSCPTFQTYPARLLSGRCLVYSKRAIQICTMDKNNQEITAVGFQRFGFDCEVPLAALRSLYLRSHYVVTADDATNTNDQEEIKEMEHHARFSQGYSAYQSKSIFHPLTHSISYTTLSRFPPVKLVTPNERKRILITGGAGFVGSHLVDRLMLLGHEVTVLDNFFTGSKTTVSHWVGHPNFELIRHDVVEPFMIECDRMCVSVGPELSGSSDSNPRNLSPCMSGVSTSLPIQCCQDHQDVLYGYSQHAWTRQAHESALSHQQYLRCVSATLITGCMVHCASRGLR
jgi:hypothetical protein